MLAPPASAVPSPRFRPAPGWRRFCRPRGSRDDRGGLVPWFRADSRPGCETHLRSWLPSFCTINISHPRMPVEQPAVRFQTAYHLFMAMTFDATLKDMGREYPAAFLATFDQPPTLPVKLLNVDLSTVTALADLVLGLGDLLAEIVQLDFQSSAAAWKHADVMAYHALLLAHYHVPVHTIVVLLRPEAAHANMTGVIR